MAGRPQTFMNAEEEVRIAHAELVAAANIARSIEGHLSQRVSAQINQAVVDAAVKYHATLYPAAVEQQKEQAPPA